MSSILVHICCAPCSAGVIEELDDTFNGNISCFYFNPNITEQIERSKRKEEAHRFLREFTGGTVPLLDDDSGVEEWHRMVAPLRHTGEKGYRCFLCYYLRLLKSFELAQKEGFTHVTTSLSISPHKNFLWLNEIGEKLSLSTGIEYLSSKWNYLRSVELSKEHDLYRQNYCGCSFSMEETLSRRNRKN